MYRFLGRTALLLAFLLPAAFITLSSASAAPSPSKNQAALRPVQIFDIAAGKVVRTIDNSPAYQAVAARWLADVRGLSSNFMPDDRCGYVFRIPLMEVQTVSTEKVSFEVQEVFLFYCRGKEMEMLAFDLKNKPYLLKVDSDLRPFLTLSGFEL